MYATEISRQVERDRKYKELEVLLLKNTEGDNEDKKNMFVNRFNESPEDT